MSPQRIGGALTLPLWQWADVNSARATEQGWCIDVPKSKTFNAESKAELQDRVWTDDGADLRRRFAIDRQFMKVFEDQDAFVTIDAWVNKSLQYREIRIYFDDPGKSQPDYEIPIMATWGYEVSDLVRHFLPWLEYEYYEEPDDSSAEIERHVMAVWLRARVNHDRAKRKQPIIGFRFHDLRHRYAVDYLRDGGNIYDLQKILGHSSIRTTELYLDYLTPDEQKFAKYGLAQNPAQV